MTILSRYIAKDFFKFWLYCLVALVAMIVVANFFGNINVVFSSWGAFYDFLDKTIRSLPGVMEILLPLTVLLATVFTFSGYSRNSELIAMQSSGMGILQQLRPVFYVLVLVSGFSYLNQNYLHRWLNAGQEVAAQNEPLKNQWRALDHALYYLDRIDPATGRLVGLRIFSWDDAAAQLLAYNTIRSAELEGNADWALRDVVNRRQADGGWALSREVETQAPASALPNLFAVPEQDLHHLPLADVYQELNQLENQRRLDLYWTEWYQKIAVLLAPFVLVLIGTPLSQFHFRKGRVSAEIMLSLLLGLVFMIGSQILFLLGKGGLVPPLLAAFGMNVLYAALGTWMLLRPR